MEVIQSRKIEAQSALNTDDSDGIARPWLAPAGVIHPDSELRKISKSWNADTWELFLVETVERSSSYQREELIKPGAYAAALDKLTESIWECSDSPADDDLATAIRRIIRDHLTPRQQQIIRLIFWDGLSERAAAEVIGLQRSTVAVQKRRSLKKLKRLIETRESIFPQVRRGRKIDPAKEDLNMQIAIVYREEISNLYGRFG